MHGVLIGFVDRAITPRGNRCGVGLERTPHVTDKAILVINGFELGRMRTIEEDSATAKEGLHVIGDIPEGLPDQGRGERFSTKPKLKGRGL
jgi:hypothetical protein